jgi:putative ABC transport system substrate-binding protein
VSHIRRREFITLLGGAAAAWPRAGWAQQASKVPRVGLLFPGTETVAPARIAALREGLRAAGYRPPDQVELITRVTGGDPSRVGPMASELVERNVDVLVPISPAAVQAVRSLTSTIPIVAFDLETAVAWLRVWRGRAATSRACSSIFPNLARSGWS